MNKIAYKAIEKYIHRRDQMQNIHFTGDDGTFSIIQPENYSYLYFPVAGEQG